MLDSTKKTIAILTAAGCLGAGGWALAADSSSTPTTAAVQAAPIQYGGPQQGQRVPQEQVTGAVADKVKAAVLAKLPGATVLRVEKDAAGYHAHVTKADGTPARVMLDADFNVTAVAEGGPAGRGGPGGPCAGGEGHGSGGGPGRGQGGQGVAPQGETPAAPGGGTTAPAPQQTTPSTGESTV